MKTSNIAIALSLIGVPAHAEIFSMKCFPEAGVPYTVTYNSDARQASITGGKTGFVRMYHAFEVKDNPSNHILHVATKALGQTRIVYLHLTIPGSTPMSAPSESRALMAAIKVTSASLTISDKQLCRCMKSAA
ncbi:MAG: hypothetical protein WCC90_02980 [Methylocella sp.]